MIVVDASTAIAWVLHEVDFINRFEQHFLSERLLAPPIWRLEVTNVILRQERQRVLTRDQGDQILKVLDEMEIEVVDLQQNQSLAELASFARPYQLTAYDAAYLDLALRESASLLTLDQNLKDAAGRLGVALLE